MADYVGAQEPNFSFHFFWVLLIVNVVFLIRIQRSNPKNKEQNCTKKHQHDLTIL